MTAAVAIRDLAVFRGRRQVLFDVSCTVPAGQVVGLLGPSGGGKTTLLRAIVGVQQIRSGTMTVLGLPAGDPALRARIGYVTQAPSVYADLSVRDNLRYFAALTSGADRIPDVLAAVGLADRAGDRVDQLSGGQRARVSLACALVGAAAAAGAGRADGGAGPGAAARPVAAVPPAGRRRQHPDRQQPRDGRGGPLRPVAAAARGPAVRRRHPGGDPAPHRGAGSGRGVPAAGYRRPDEPRRSRWPPPGGCCGSCATTRAPSRCWWWPRAR